MTSQIQHKTMNVRWRGTTVSLRKTTPEDMKGMAWGLIIEYVPSNGTDPLKIAHEKKRAVKPDEEMKEDSAVLLWMKDGATWFVGKTANKKGVRCLNDVVLGFEEPLPTWRGRPCRLSMTSQPCEGMVMAGTLDLDSNPDIVRKQPPGTTVTVGIRVNGKTYKVCSTAGTHVQSVDDMPNADEQLTWCGEPVVLPKLQEVPRDANYAWLPAVALEENETLSLKWHMNDAATRNELLVYVGGEIRSLGSSPNVAPLLETNALRERLASSSSYDRFKEMMNVVRRVPTRGAKLMRVEQLDEEDLRHWYDQICRLPEEGDRMKLALELLGEVSNEKLLEHERELYGLWEKTQTFHLGL